ncbi:sigma-70 family RNA polymerase sigma factor [Stieleria sp.]|uniref:sigma-70 family RNA polymerase sigma factor n=1 Tax=Stieleria sp. TaxID=2795976 RepID=UPI0035692C5C
MSSHPLRADPSSFLERARQGDEQALGALLQAYRPYLSLLARLKTDRALQSKLSDSDLVQETSLAAHRDFARFRGATEPELTAWLREIMAHVAANAVRDLNRQRRDVHLERQLSDHLNHSSRTLERALVDPKPSPSQSAVRRERAVLLANALHRLPTDYREVLVMRELQEKPLAEVAELMGRTVNATQKLWARAVVQLRRLMQSQQESS